MVEQYALTHFNFQSRLVPISKISQALVSPLLECRSSALDKGYVKQSGFVDLLNVEHLDLIQLKELFHIQHQNIFQIHFSHIKTNKKKELVGNRL